MPAWERFLLPFMAFFRRRRLRRFVAAYPDLPSLSVLDVGGRPHWWELLRQETGLWPRRLVLLNSEGELARAPGYERVRGDGRALPYRSKSFDLVFSNSVIEHVGGAEDRRRFARECERVGRELYVQTPNRWFPIEPHLVTALVHWLPRRLYRRVAFVSLLRLFHRKDPEGFYRTFDGTRLLGRGELARLFAGRRIAAERLAGLAKSYIVSDRELSAAGLGKTPVLLGGHRFGGRRKGVV